MHHVIPPQRYRTRWAGAPALALILGFAIATSAHAALAPASQTSQSPQFKNQVQAALGGLSVPFEANNGQWDAQVAFKAQTFAGQVFVTQGGSIVYSLPGPVQAPAANKNKAQAKATAKTQPASQPAPTSPAGALLKPWWARNPSRPAAARPQPRISAAFKAAAATRPPPTTASTWAKPGPA